LDQFLEDLIHIGIPKSSMVRLGSKFTPETQSLLLRNQTSTYRRGQADWSIIDNIKDELRNMNSKLSAASAHFMNTAADYQLILAHIEFEDPDFFYAFEVPQDQDGMQTIGKNNKAADSYYLIEQWSLGRGAGIFRNAKNVTESAEIWRMQFTARKEKITKWLEDAQLEQITNIFDLTKKYNNCVSRLDSKFRESKNEPLLRARIIGCTTTAAAMNREALYAAAPGILLVEEAGEILESHVLTSLSPKTKQVILIGDHKYVPRIQFTILHAHLALCRQLRPKVNNYLLTVEKGDGYDLNRSMFERLVLKGYPHETLNQQHRMRPEISALVRALMYPDLVDAPSTRGRPDLQGVQDNIVFIHHEQPEGELQELRPDQPGQEAGRKSSKTNHHEVQMVLMILRYISQQVGNMLMCITIPYSWMSRAMDPKTSLF
jgi:hypothetical protein